MKRLLLLLLSLLLLVVACQAPTPEIGAGDAPQAGDGSAPATEAATAVPTETPPAARPAEATPTAETAAAGGFLCPEIGRPALAMDLVQDYQIVEMIVDPVSGESCQPNLPEEVGLYQAAGDALYYAVEENGQLLVKRLTAEGSQPLAFTAVDVSGPHHAYHTFVVSEDGTTLAWAAGTTGAEGNGGTESQIWVGQASTGNVWAPLPPYLSGDGDGLRRVLTPVRFSADNSVLYYSLMPYGIGGAWNAFSGRYDNLYAVRWQGEGEAEVVFDCSPLGVTLCLGDFFVVDNQVTALAYVNGERQVVVANGAGEVLNRIEVDGGYVAYPTWGPSGELIFYAADVEETEGPPRATAATIYRVAPHTAPAEVLAGDPNLLPPQAWLDETRAVVGYLQGDTLGTAIVDVNGNVQVREGAFQEVIPLAGAPGATMAGE